MTGQAYFVCGDRPECPCLNPQVSLLFLYRSRSSIQQANRPATALHVNYDIKKALSMVMFLMPVLHEERGETFLFRSLTARDWSVPIRLARQGTTDDFPFRELLATRKVFRDKGESMHLILKASQGPED